MRLNRNFHTNPAFFWGVALLWISSFIRHVLELEGPIAAAAHLLGGAACGLLFLGLLAGSPKTRPLFHKFHAFKTRLLGKGGGTPC